MRHLFIFSVLAIAALFPVGCASDRLEGGGASDPTDTTADPADVGPRDVTSDIPTEAGLDAAPDLDVSEPEDVDGPGQDIDTADTSGPGDADGGDGDASDDPDGGGGGRTGDPVTDVLASIIIDIPGYARGTIGGRDGTVYEVTTLADSGEGSLRAGLESEAPLWIVFEDGLNGTIALERVVEVQSYKTVDARGHQITLQAVRDEGALEPTEGWDDTGVSLGRPGDTAAEVHDVVLLNLTFDGTWPDPDFDGKGAQGLLLHNNVHHVWVHRCTFHNWIDGGIEARIDDGFGTLPHHVSITESHFYDIDEGLLFSAVQLTFARNFCDNLNQRCVKTLEGGSVHMVNNVIKDWRDKEIVFAKDDSQILVDHNIFRPGADSRLAGESEGTGNLQDLHNIEYRGSRYHMGERGSVTPEFKREAQAAYGLERRVDCEHDPPDGDCWDALYEDVVAGAGAAVD